MFTGYSKEESEMMQINLHPGGTASTDFSTPINAASTPSNSEAKDMAAGANNFGNSRQFEFDMAGESLW